MGLALTAVLLLALGFSGYRFFSRRSHQSRWRRLPGGSPESAMPVSSFDELDSELTRRRCHCGGRYDRHGEGPVGAEGRVLRSVAVECRRCEERTRVYFDLTVVYH